MSVDDGDAGSDPMFAGPINNVTVNVGREAVLECPVNSLGQYKECYSCYSRQIIKTQMSGGLAEGC